MIEITLLRGEDESRTLGAYESVQMTGWLLRDPDGRDIIEYHGDGWYVMDEGARIEPVPWSGPWSDFTIGLGAVTRNAQTAATLVAGEIRAALSEGEAEWECGSCGAFIDLTIADDGDLYHDPDEDCRAVRALHKVTQKETA